MVPASESHMSTAPTTLSVLPRILPSTSKEFLIASAQAMRRHETVSMPDELWNKCRTSSNILAKRSYLEINSPAILLLCYAVLVIHFRAISEPPLHDYDEGAYMIRL
jgi:hypothetical protein